MSIQANASNQKTMRNHDPWHAPSKPLRLAENEVHVWRARMAMSESTIEHLRHFLAHEELERARCFYFEKDRCNWTVAHALLRSIFGQYLNCDPRSLRFTTNNYGKPLLVSPVGGKRLHFSLSHSGDLALYAFAYQSEVGVDVEQMRAGINYRELATRYFSVRECAALEALSADLQATGFFPVLVTRKRPTSKHAGRDYRSHLISSMSLSSPMKL